MATTSGGNGNSKSGFVVWEWFNENGRWRPYDSIVTNQIENHYGKISRVQLGAVDSSLHMYVVDFPSMCQIRQGSGTARPVRRQVYPLTTSSANQFTWQWSGDHPGSWNTYDFDVASVLEDAFCRGQSLLDLSSHPLQQPYYINLQTLSQIRIETGTVRSIRRQQLAVAYPVDRGLPSSQNAPLSQSAPLSQIAPLSQSASQPFSMPATSSTFNGTKRGLSSSSDSDSDGGIPNGAVRFTRSSRKKHKSNSSKTVGSSLNIPNPALSFPQSVMFGNNASSLLQSFAPQSHLGSTLSMSSAAPPPPSSGASVFSVIPPSHHATPASTGGLYPGPLTRSRYNMAASNMAAPPGGAPCTTTGYLPPSSNLLFGNHSLPLSHLHHRFLNSPPGGHNIPLALSSGKGRASRISPGVSNITTVLVSPAVPVAFSTHKSSAFPPPNANSATPQSIEGAVAGRIVLPKQRKSRSKTADEVLKRYLRVEGKHPDEDCCICYDKLHEESTYGSSESLDHQVVSLAKCSHIFHRMCLYAMYDSGHKDGSIQCPTCKTIYGERYGNCPAGEMEYSTIPHTLPGYPDCQTIRIGYHINPGVQGQEHPNPGKRFNARGFPRYAYLPDNEKGRKVLKLLAIAWQRRLMFTVGMSTTTGESDTVTWNEIHHKTEFGSNISGHGYPDPNYLDNVTSELSVQGVSEEDLGS